MARRQLAGLVVLGLVGGLGLGVALAAGTDARRADSSYARLRHRSSAPDALFDATGLADEDAARLAALPGVAGFARFSYTPVAPEPLVPGQDAGAFVGLDPDFLVRVYRPVPLQGRLPDPGRGDEVVVNEALARAAHLTVGHRVTLASGFEDAAPIGTATVVGVVRGIFDVGANAGSPAMYLSRTFLDAHRDGVQVGPQPAALLRLARGEAGLAPFEQQAEAAIGRPVTPQFSGREEARPMERTLRVQTVGLLILGMVAGLATLAAVIQALHRVMERALVDLPTLVAIGVRPRESAILGALLAAPVAALSGIAGLVAVLVASPRLPTGFARRVDPLRGVHLDAAVLVLGLLVWGLTLAAAGAVLAWRLDRRKALVMATGRVRRGLSRLPHQMRLGFEAALVPLRSAGGAAARAALIAAIVSVGALVALSTFGASLHHLLGSPALQGWSFDAAISNGDVTLDDLHRSLEGMQDDPAVSRVAWVTLAFVQIAGTPFEAYVFDPDAGEVHPTMRSGRPPLADDEIAVGEDLLRGSHLSVGDRVAVGGPGGEARLVIVGAATYPEIGNNSDLGTGISITRAAARRVGAEEHGAVALVRLSSGHVVRDLQRYVRDGAELVTPFRPPRVRNLEQVGSLPWALAALAAILGLLAVGHGLWSSVRARRRDLAVLASIGFRPRDLRAVLLWQVTCLAVIGVVVGGVSGVVLGAWSWSIVATATAVVDQPIVPAALLAAIGGGALVACGVVGLIGGRWARTRRLAAGLLGE
jgi:hypothetical protein